jgi:hypothetical protein
MLDRIREPNVCVEPSVRDEALVEVPESLVPFFSVDVSMRRRRNCWLFIVVVVRVNFNAMSLLSHKNARSHLSTFKE